MPILHPDREVLLTRQRHDADRAGLHFDYRIVVGDKAYSWATKKDFPAPGKSIILWQQPDHSRSYAMSRYVSIPKGQYGAGITKLQMVQKAKVVNPSEDGNKFSLHMKDGTKLLFKKLPYSQRDDAWLFRNVSDTMIDHNKYLDKAYEINARNIK